MIKFDFTSRVGVVTGAGGGMGLEIANGLLKAGGSVVAIDLKPQPKSLISDRCLYAQGNLVDDRFVHDAINTGAAQFGLVDLVYLLGSNFLLLGRG